MTYRQIVERIIDACEPLAEYPELVYRSVFEILLLEVLKYDGVLVSDDTSSADRAEADPATDN